MNHELVDEEPVDEEPIDAGDPDRTKGEFQNDRRSRDMDTVSSWSSLSTPPPSDNEQERTSDDLSNEPRSLAASVESAALDSLPSRPHGRLQPTLFGVLLLKRPLYIVK